MFQLGQVVATRNALNNISVEEIRKALNRHSMGDWGDLCEEDKELNDYAVKNGQRILSSYTSKEDIKFWIITEADRSFTTVLLPEDY